MSTQEEPCLSQNEALLGMAPPLPWGADGPGPAKPRGKKMSGLMPSAGLLDFQPLPPQALPHHAFVEVSKPHSRAGGGSSEAQASDHAAVVDTDQHAPPSAAEVDADTNTDSHTNAHTEAADGTHTAKEGRAYTTQAGATGTGKENEPFDPVEMFVGQLPPYYMEVRNRSLA